MHHLPAAASCLLVALAVPLTAQPAPTGDKQTDWCSFLGLDGDDWLIAMKTDELGRIWVCGATDRAIQVTANAYQPGLAGGHDAFVACVDPRLPIGQQIVWSTHIGGTGDELACDLDVGAAGARVTVVGYTRSIDFPVRAGWQMHSGGGRDGFVAVFDPGRSGTAQLSWASYLGGSLDDSAASVDESNGWVTIAGTTESTDFPTVGAWQPTLAGGRDVFDCRLPTAGSQPLLSTYLGGSANDGADNVPSPFGKRSVHLVVDDLGVVTVATSTSSVDYPNPGGVLVGPAGGLDLAVSRFDAAGSRVTHSAILGGTMNERCNGLRADGADRIVLVGRSDSTDFYVTPNRLKDFVGGQDGILVHLDVTQGQLLYATYVGGSAGDFPMSGYREPGGTFVIAGYSYSSDYPTTTLAPQPDDLGADGQGFLTRLRPGATSTALQYSTWFGGRTHWSSGSSGGRPGSQAILAIEPDGQGGVVAAGPTVSIDFPTTGNAFDTGFGGVREGWIAVHRMLPEAVSRFGHATDACRRPISLQLSSAPLARSAGFAVETHDAPAAAVGVLAFGTPLPAGLRVLDADLFVSPWLTSVVIVADPNGFASQPVLLPAGFVWDGRLALQSLWLAPVGCNGLLGASNALR